MSRTFEYMTNLQYEVKCLRALVASFESGEKYVRMEEEHRRAMKEKDREIQKLKKELAASRKETIDVRNKWMQTCEDVVKEAEAARKGKDREVRKALSEKLEAQRQRDEALSRLREKNQELYEVKVQLLEEEEKNKELTARVNRDYTNSSRSSSQSPNHKKIHNSREKSGRRPGGQPGHPHHGRKKQEPGQIIHIPAPEELEGNEEYHPTGKMIRRQLIVLNVTTEVIEFVTPEYIHKKTGKKTHASFPEGITDDVNYDGTVKAAAYILNNECCVSIGKTKEFLKEVSSGKIDLSTGMVCGLAGEFSKKTEAERDEIFLELLASDHMHVDFTFGRVNGGQGTVIICKSGDRVLYQGRAKKGHEGVKGSPAELYEGTVISDHESTFQKYGTRHQECLAHVERYLRSSIENEPELKWNQEMLEWVKGAVHYHNSLGEGAAAEREKVDELTAKFQEILEKARKEYEDVPPGDYFRDGYNLYKRMAETPADYLLFLEDPSIPPTNNAAENAARKYKRKSAQAMGFRSEKGRDCYCDGLSVMEGIKSKEENLYEGVAARFNQRA